MKKIKMSHFSLFLMFFFISCMDSYDSSLKVINQSNKSIFTVLSNNDDMFGSGYYEEFKDYQYTNKDSVFSFKLKEIRPNVKYDCYGNPTHWETYLRRTNDKKVRLFVIPKDTVDKYGWRIVFKNQIYFKKFKFSIEDLEKRNWEFTYE